MGITKERLLEIASLSDWALSDERIVSPHAYESVTSILGLRTLHYDGKHLDANTFDLV